MNQTVAFKRKNIDLPTETLKKLSIVAAAQGKSLKAYIENTLIKTAESINIHISENPSPSNDEWFDNTENIQSIKRGIEDIKAGKKKEYTIDELKDLLNI